MKHLLCLIIVASILYSCNFSVSDHDSGTFTSTDTAKLAQIIDIRTFKPEHAKFKYTFVDNPAKNERFGVPGPSYSKLEAVLYFDSSTFAKIVAGYKSAAYKSPGFEAKEFAFDWLDTDVKDETNKSDSSYKGSPDLIFGSNKNGGLWFLNNKILVLKFSN